MVLVCHASLARKLKEYEIVQLSKNEYFYRITHRKTDREHFSIRSGNDISGMT